MVTRVVEKDTMCKMIKMNDSIISALVDTGCDVNLVRCDVLKCMNVVHETYASTKLMGAGGKSIQTFGHFITAVLIDDDEFRTKLYVANESAIPMLAISGKEQIAEAEVIMKQNHISIKKCAKIEPNRRQCDE